MDIEYLCSATYHIVEEHLLMGFLKLVHQLAVLLGIVSTTFRFHLDTIINRTLFIRLHRLEG